VGHSLVETLRAVRAHGRNGAWATVLVLLAFLTSSAARAKNEDETYTFQFINLTTAEKLQKICELPGWELKMDDEATRKLAAFTRRSGFSLRAATPGEALQRAIADLGTEQAGLVFEIKNDVVHLAQRQVQDEKLAISLPAEKLPTTLGSGPLRFEVKTLSAGPDQLALRMTTTEPRDIRWLCNGQRDGWQPRLRLKSGKDAYVFGRAGRDGNTLTLEGRVLGATPADPPACLTWEIRWWKP
jgi:hypothetical protein